METPEKLHGLRLVRRGRHRYAVAMASDLSKTKSDQAQDTAGGGHSAGEVAPLSPHRAFVVQFRTRAGREQDPFVGRVEHIVSGHSARFDSLEALAAFIKQVLAEVVQ